MSCQNSYDSKLAKDCQGYYFCCYNKGQMVDHEDCKKCKEFQYREV